MHALLHGDDDFGKALMIVNTSGWDTDCNSGNLGCLLGIQHASPAIDAGPDWRGPVSDICYLPSADSGGGVSDAATQATRIIRMGHALAGSDYEAPKEGARYHFAYAGSVQGFAGRKCVVQNRHNASGERALAIHFDRTESGDSVCATTATFVDSLDTAKYFERARLRLDDQPNALARANRSCRGGTGQECRRAGGDGYLPARFRRRRQAGDAPQSGPLRSAPATVRRCLGQYRI